jgi:nucleoside-diphosphate-sugar epimerase
MRVLVTGGTGFLGSWCIKVLLDRGYDVHTTVRTLDKANFLLQLDHASERLTIFPGVDLLVEGAFEEAMTGCECVLHTASPYFVGSEEDLLPPAVNGTRNVLTSCNKLGVSKVILTSSMVAVFANYGTVSADHIYSDADWTPEDVVREKGNWYCLSKTVAEKVAWDMSRAEGCSFQLAVMNPTLILGPHLPGQSHLNTSSSVIAAFLNGKMTVLDNMYRTFVDVRDVAEAHVAAIETPEAFGKRFVLIGCCRHQSQVADAIREVAPESLKANVPTTVSDKIPPHVFAQPPPLQILYDASPSESILHIRYRDFEGMMKDTVDSLGLQWL